MKKQATQTPRYGERSKLPEKPLTIKDLQR
jgi:hypothetical protein